MEPPGELSTAITASTLRGCNEYLTASGINLLTTGSIYSILSLNKDNYMGFPTLLTLIFIVLKLTGNINWSWWMVMMPMIVEFIAWLCVALFLIVYGD